MKGSRGENAPDTCNGMESSITYTVALATRRTLGSRQTSVSLLSLLTRGSNKADQTGVTLQDDKNTRSLCVCLHFHICVHSEA